MPIHVGKITYSFIFRTNKKVTPGLINCEDIEFLRLGRSLCKFKFNGKDYVGGEALAITQTSLLATSFFI